MECQDTIKSLKINLKKKIHTIVLVVEGARYEFELFDHIFRKLLHYQLVTKVRGKTEFKEYNEFVMKDNLDQKVIVVNTKNSNIGSIVDDMVYRNELYKMLYEKYSLDVKNVPVYYIWDRDCASNQAALVKELILKLNNPYMNEEFENGLLLLSYPCSEAYTISCFEKGLDELPAGTGIKDYVKRQGYHVSLINQHKVKRAAIEMIHQLENIGIHDFDIDDISRIHALAFELEEKYYRKHHTYLLLSFISYVLLDQGIITFKEMRTEEAETRDKITVG